MPTRRVARAAYVGQLPAINHHRASLPTPKPVRLPVFQMVICPPYSAKLVEKQCVGRWAVANGRAKAKGSTLASLTARASVAVADSMRSSRCRRCPLGEARYNAQEPAPPKGKPVPAGTGKP